MHCTHIAGCCETPEDTHLLGRVNNAFLHGRHVKKSKQFCVKFVDGLLRDLNTSRNQISIASSKWPGVIDGFDV